MKCPICTSPISFSEDGSSCQNGHVFSMRNGVHQIMTPEYKLKVETFLSGFEALRHNEIAKYSPEILRKLPLCDFDKGMWNLRQMDLKLVNQQMVEGGLVLEVGAWNSWLTQHLVKGGMQAVAIDIFSHEIDGLGAKQHYDKDWLAIQMDLQQLHILDEKFDLIIINRTLPYFKDIMDSLHILKSLLTATGKLLITGITYEANSGRIERQLDSAAKNFEEKYNTPFMLHEFKGYLTKSDLNAIKSIGINLKYYPELKFKSIAAKVISSRPIYYYGIFEQAL